MIILVCPNKKNEIFDGLKLAKLKRKPIKDKNLKFEFMNFKFKRNTIKSY